MMGKRGVMCHVSGFSVIILLISLQIVCAAAPIDPQKGKNQEEKKQDDPYLWDFGKIKAGEVAKHDFVFKNSGTKALTIKNVQTSCGCTGSKAEKNILTPGESTLIEVKFNSAKYSGPVQQFIYVNTDDVDNQIVRYIIKAEVIKE